MNISESFIRKPVMTTLLMAALVIFGVFGYFSLPVSELPSVDFPTIVVSASLLFFSLWSWGQPARQ